MVPLWLQPEEVRVREQARARQAGRPRASAAPRGQDADCHSGDPVQLKERSAHDTNRNAADAYHSLAISCHVVVSGSLGTAEDQVWVSSSVSVSDHGCERVSASLSVSESVSVIRV